MAESTTQKLTFLDSEGDAYFERNPKDCDCDSDPVVLSLSRLGVVPKRVLEIGCSGGARLDCVSRRIGGECYGIDPSHKAIEHAKKQYSHLTFAQGTADDLPYPDQHFDTVIFGFCLYLCDTQDHFRISWQVDRVLQQQGFLIIKDFLPPFAFKNEYSHKPGIRSHKMNWAGMFTWHPAYSLLSREYVEHAKPYSYHPNERISVDVLRKDTAFAFPTNPLIDAAE